MPRAPARVDVAAVVTAFYRVLLMREPDGAGLEAHGGALAAGTVTIEQALAAFLGSAEFQTVAPRVLAAHAPAEGRRFTNDHSQFGEFGLLLAHWVNEAARHRIVVDVGARGRERSNSYDLLRVFGWRGLLIEANPALIETIRAEFAGLDMALLSLAVSDHDGEAVFHIGANDDVSSLNAAAAEGWGPLRGEARVRVSRLGPLLEAHGIPTDFDLLSLDIEGEDLKVLDDLIATTAYRPGWIIVEASYDYATRSLDDLDVAAAVRSGYAIAGQTPANLILRRLG